MARATIDFAVWRFLWLMERWTLRGDGCRRSLRSGSPTRISTSVRDELPARTLLSLPLSSDHSARPGATWPPAARPGLCTMDGHNVHRLSLGDAGATMLVLVRRRAASSTDDFPDHDRRAKRLPDGRSAGRRAAQPRQGADRRRRAARPAEL